MEIRVTCPLGSQCEEIKDNKVQRCRWFMNVKGKDPQSEEIIDRWDCAMVWQVVVGIEQAQMTRGVQSATESFRNEMVKGQRDFALLIEEKARYAIPP